MGLQTTLGKEFSDPLFQRALLDVHMMVVHNGAERTVTEWYAAARYCMPLFFCLLLRNMRSSRSLKFA